MWAALLFVVLGGALGQHHAQLPCPATRLGLAQCAMRFLDANQDGFLQEAEFDAWHSDSECGRLGGTGAALTGARVLSECGNSVNSALDSCLGAGASERLLEVLCRKCRECTAIEARTHPTPMPADRDAAFIAAYQAYLANHSGTR